MSWHEIAPRQTGRGGYEGISLSVRKGPREGTFDLSIVIGPSAASEMGIADGDRVQVHLGQGQHQGQMLIQRTSLVGWKTRTRGRRHCETRLDAARVGITVSDPQPITPAIYAINDKQQAVITLPDWCIPSPVVPIQTLDDERRASCH